MPRLASAGCSSPAPSPTQWGTRSRSTSCGRPVTTMSISPEHTCISICPAPRTRNRIPAFARRILHRRARGRPRWLVDADDDSFGAAVAGPLPVLVYLSAPWCEPCRLLGLAVVQAASEFAGRLKVVTVNVDGAPATAPRLGAQTVPTMSCCDIAGSSPAASAPCRQRRSTAGSVPC